MIAGGYDYYQMFNDSVDATSGTNCVITTSNSYQDADYYSYGFVEDKRLKAFLKQLEKEGIGRDTHTHKIMLEFEIKPNTELYIKPVTINRRMLFSKSGYVPRKIRAIRKSNA